MIGDAISIRPNLQKKMRYVVKKTLKIWYISPDSEYIDPSVALVLIRLDDDTRGDGGEDEGRLPYSASIVSS